MVITIILLALMGWAFAALLRAVLLAWYVRQVAEGRRAPMVFVAGGVRVPAGDELVLALGGGRWEPVGPPPPGPAVTLGRTTVHLTMRGIERRIDGLAKRERGQLVLTDRAISWRGKQGTIDVALRDVEHLEVKGGLISIRRRSRPSHPLVLGVPQPVPVAQLIAVLSAQALGHRVTATPAP